MTFQWFGDAAEYAKGGAGFSAAERFSCSMTRRTVRKGESELWLLLKLTQVEFRLIGFPCDFVSWSVQQRIVASIALERSL